MDKPVPVSKSIKKYDKVLFGRGTSPYQMFTLLYNVTVTTKDTRSKGYVTFVVTGNLSDGREIQSEGYAYKKGRSPWKFASKGLTPLEVTSGIISSAQDLIHFLFEPGEWDRSYKYKFPQWLLDKPGWVEKQLWEEW